jgi:outer membrane beta-barrel protein
MFSTLLTLAGMFVAPAMAEEPAPIIAPNYLQTPYYFEGLDGIVQDDEEPEDSVRSEQEAVRRGSDKKDESDGSSRRRVIMTIQKKNFLKVGRVEIGPTVGAVVNDPFLNRFIIGAIADYHFTEVFGVELQVAYAPIFGTGGENDPDWKQLSKTLREENSVAPDISKLTFNSSLSLMFSPIYGKAAIFRTILIFDIFGNFGAGIVQTSDDLVALGASEDDDEAVATQNQWHPTTIIGAGIRVAFNRTVAVRLEGKSMTYVEVINSSTLEMKNNFIAQGSVTFFFPNLK